MLGLEPGGPLARTLAGEQSGEPCNPDVGAIGAQLGHNPTPVVLVFGDAYGQSEGTTCLANSRRIAASTINPGGVRSIQTSA